MVKSEYQATDSNFVDGQQAPFVKDELVKSGIVKSGLLKSEYVKSEIENSYHVKSENVRSRPVKREHLMGELAQYFADPDAAGRSIVKTEATMSKKVDVQRAIRMATVIRLEAKPKSIMHSHMLKSLQASAVKIEAS